MSAPDKIKYQGSLYLLAHPEFNEQRLTELLKTADSGSETAKQLIFDLWESADQVRGRIRTFLLSKREPAPTLESLARSMAGPMYELTMAYNALKNETAVAPKIQATVAPNKIKYRGATYVLSDTVIPPEVAEQQQKNVPAIRKHLVAAASRLVSMEKDLELTAGRLYELSEGLLKWELSDEIQKGDPVAIELARDLIGAVHKAMSVLYSKEHGVVEKYTEVKKELASAEAILNHGEQAVQERQQRKRTKEDKVQVAPSERETADWERETVTLPPRVFANYIRVDGQLYKLQG